MYQVAVTAGYAYTFKTGCGDGATADFDTYLELYDASCSYLTGNDDGCESARSKIDWVAQQTGYVYLNVRGYSSSSSGAYTLAYATCNVVLDADFTYNITGNTVNFSNSESTPNLNYSWNFGDGNTSSLQNPTHTYDCSGTYYVELIMDDGAVCSASSYSTVSIQGSNLSADFTHSANNTTVNFTNTSTGTGLTYYWYFGDGATSTLTDPTHTYDCPGDYYVELTATDGNGCEEYTYEYINVESDLSADFTYTENNSTVNFTNTSTGTGLTYYWYFGDGNTSTLTDPTHTYDCQGTYYVELSATDMNGCQQYEGMYVTIDGDLNAGFSQAINNTTVNFTNTSTGTSLTYIWYFGDGNTSTLTDPTHTYDCPGTYYVDLYVTDGNGCEAYSSNYMTIQSDLNAGYTYTANNTTVNFTNTSAGTGLTYYWYFGDGNTSTLTDPTHTYDCPGTYYVDLIVTDGNGCEAYSGNYITVQGNLSAGFTYTANNTTVNFTNTSAGTGLTYYWYFGDGNTSTLTDPTHTYDCPGDYYVDLYVTDGNGCEAYSSNYVTVQGDLSADFTHAANNTTINFTNTSTGTGLTYYWYFGDGTTSTLTDPTHTYNCPGGYYVELTATDGNGCEDYTYEYINIESDLSADFTYTSSGTTVGFTNASTGTGLNYFWEFGDGNNSTQANPTHTYACQGSYYVYLTITNGDGCQQLTTEYVTVEGNLSASFEYTVSGNTVNFSNTSVGTGLSYYWEFGDGTTSSLANPTHTYDCQGFYYVYLTVEDENGCYTYSSEPVEVEGDIEAGFTYVLNGSTVTFANNSTGNGLTYYWSFYDGNSSTLENPTHTYTCQGVYYVTLQAIDANGCSSSYGVYIEIEGNLEADFSMSGTGNTISFNDQSMGSPTSWSWDFGDGNYSSQQNPGHTYSCPGDYWVYLTVQNSNGCTDYYEEEINVGGFSAEFSYVVTGNTVVFTNHSNGAVSSEWSFGDGSSSSDTDPTHIFDCGEYYVTLIVENDNGCVQYYDEYILISGGVQVTASYTINNSTVDFSSSTSGSNLTYTWEFGDGETSNLANPSHTYDECGAYYAYVLVEDDQGCIDYEVFEIYIEGNATVTVSSNSPVCVGEDIMLSGTFSSSNFYWVGPDGFYSYTPNPTISNSSHDNEGEYTLVVTDGNGCPSTGMVDVTVNENDLTITQTGGVLKSNQDGGTYQWIDCSNNMPITGATSQSFTPTSNGTYMVQVSVDGCPTENSDCVVVDNVGINDRQASKFTLYPNPNNGLFAIQGPSANYVLEVYNSLGQMLLSEVATESQTNLNLEMQPNGVYHVIVRTNDNVSLFKVIKQ